LSATQTKKGIITCLGWRKREEEKQQFQVYMEKKSDVKKRNEKKARKGKTKLA